MLVGKILKKIRLELELTQEGMSKRLGMSQPYYSSIESNKKKISDKSFKKICSVLDVNPEYFITNVENRGERLKKMSAELRKNNDTDGLFVNMSVNTRELDNIIDLCIRNIEFFGTDLLYRIYHMNNPEINSAKVENEVQKIREYIAQYKGDPIAGIEATYMERSPEEKIIIIGDLSRATQQILSRLWDLTQHVWLKNLKS